MTEQDNHSVWTLVNIIYILSFLAMSAIVHEFSHWFVGTMIGYDIVSISVDVFRMTGWTAYSNPRTSLFWMFSLAGGVFQGVFLFGTSFLVKNYRYARYSLWYLSVVCLIYGIVEMIIY